MYRVGVLVLLGFVGVAFGFECPSEGQHFFPHPTRCAKFIECNNGIKAEQICFGDMIFNPEVGHCDFRENFHCEDVEEPGEGPLGECPLVNGDYVDFLTDAGSCHIFYMCNWGTPFKFECPDGLHFNPTINVCDWPDNARCTLEE